MIGISSLLTTFTELCEESSELMPVSIEDPEIRKAARTLKTARMIAQKFGFGNQLPITDL
jgi:hypothetical protein